MEYGKDFLQTIEDKEVYLLDFSFLMYKSYHALRHLSVRTSTGMVRPTGHIYGILNAVTKIKDKNKDAVVFVTLDGFPADRKALCDSIGVGYKDGRTKLDYPIKSDTDLICDILQQIPDVYIVEDENEECDDLMYALSRELPKSNKCFIVTKDRDLLQALNDNTFLIESWLDEPEILTQDNLYEKETIKKNFAGVDVRCITIFRAIIGDKSDNLPGIPRFPKVLAKQIAEGINHITELKNISERIEVKPTQRKYLYAIENEYERIVKYYQIMKLSENISYGIYREVKPVKHYIEELSLNTINKWLANHDIRPL